MIFPLAVARNTAHADFAEIFLLYRTYRPAFALTNIESDWLRHNPITQFETRMSLPKNLKIHSKSKKIYIF